jgi:hypothetical protein
VLIDHLFGFFTLASANVTHRNNLHILLPKEYPHIPRPLGTQTDAAHCNPVAWCQTARLAQS